MRAIVASLLVLTAAPAVAQKAPDLPPEVLSPTLMQGWQTQQPAARPEDQAKLALQWAKQPSDFFASNVSSEKLLNRAQRFDRSDRPMTGHRPSTVGQGSQ